MIKRGAVGALVGALLWVVPAPAALADVSARNHGHRDQRCWDDRDGKRHGDHHRGRDRDCRRGDCWDGRKDGRKEWNGDRDGHHGRRDRDCRDKNHRHGDHGHRDGDHGHRDGDHRHRDGDHDHDHHHHH